MEEIKVQTEGQCVRSEGVAVNVSFGIHTNVRKGSACSGEQANEFDVPPSKEKKDREIEETSGIKERDFV